MQYRVEKDKGCKSCPLTMNANITAFIPGWICDKDGSPCDSPIAKKKRRTPGRATSPFRSQPITPPRCLAHAGILFSTRATPENWTSAIPPGRHAVHTNLFSI